LVSPITNILIIPLLPFIMVLGFVSGLAGMLWHFLGWIFSLPNWFLLTYFVKTIDFFSQLPMASLAISSMHWLWVIIYYSFLAYLIWHLNKKQNQKLKFLKY
jgi:competence protein ComEC